jgi:predicted aldo/keto reductase-like oxidoreductase
MLAYSIIDQEHVGAEILPLCRKNKVGVIVMKPLCGGALVMPRARDELKPERDPIVRANLRHVISNRWVATAIPGIQSVQEVEENCAVGRSIRPLSPRGRRRLLRLIGSFGASLRYGQRCLRCGYCLPCPNGIAIPDIFRALDEYQGYPGNVKQIGLETYRSLKVKPDVCKECRRCVRRCPGGIDIPAKLKQARMVLEQAAHDAG